MEFSNPVSCNCPPDSLTKFRIIIDGRFCRLMIYILHPTKLVGIQINILSLHPRLIQCKQKNLNKGSSLKHKLQVFNAGKDYQKFSPQPGLRYVL